MGSWKLSSLMGGLVLSFLLVGLVQAAEYSAVMVTKTHGREIQAKFFVKGDKQRSEVSTPAYAGINIVRWDKKIMWMLNPGQKSYMEMPISQQALMSKMSLATDVSEAGVTKKLLGTETLNGSETEKYEISGALPNGREWKHFIWISKKTRIPLRIESADKSFTIDYKDIKEGGVDDALFEIPAGYQKTDLSAGMPKMK